ncbi:DUF551 domain-containing protein [Eikenella corrodens]|uniref:DUF551 domain-containing protein n=1 Tax=Eikenella corrodens TaxID=539 RepID=A0A1A9RCS3_EIKCO|nr:hypothetical protein A7P90_11545 [Eikenella corrodens]
MTPEGIERERRAFESWYSRAYLPAAAHGRTFSKYQAGTYRLQHVQDAWQAWQARAAQSEWISVEDRLPEYKNDREQFLIMCQWKREPKTYFYKTSRLLKMLDHIYFDSEPCGADVIYWQPLPAPPTTNPAA